jgi:hypothetical protein
VQDTLDLEPKCGDAARRMSSAVTLAAMNGGAGRWLAVKLQDGSSDHVLYDSRSAAMAHQLSPEYALYLLIPPDGMTTGQADRVLGFWRDVYDAGGRATDPRDDYPSMPLTRPDGLRQIRLLTGR